MIEEERVRRITSFFQIVPTTPIPNVSIIVTTSVSYILIEIEQKPRHS
jgi:hypothetical protein